ncbi:MAG: hypothetical protein H0U16_11295 [Actinobacteria bacterium]|nr:hypothetical protein [Actinomycetota bacterium]
MKGDDGPNLLRAGAGDDVIVGRAGKDRLLGGRHFCCLDPDADLIRGGGGRDSLFGGPGEDDLRGGAALDRLFGGGGDDSVDGGEGSDRAFFEAPVTADLSTGIATGEGNDDLTSIEGLVGSFFDDILTGDEGDNILIGNRGNDTLDGRAGFDRCVTGETVSNCEA